MEAYFSKLAFLSIAVFLCAILGTALMRYLAHRYGWVAQPRRDRWHREATALHGGIGFSVPFLLGACWVLVWHYEQHWLGWNILIALPHEVVLAGTLLVGSLLMFLVGLIDDLKDLRPATKLIAQVVAASLFIFAGGVFPLTGSPLIDTLVTYFWFVGIINAINMLDNMDGLASGVVIIAGTTLAVLALYAPEPVGRIPLVVSLCVLFAAAVLGFWLHNRPPATIFMGDSGSLFMGYTLAALAVPSSLNNFLGTQVVGEALGAALVLLIPATVLAVPIFDTTLVTITRKLRTQKASQGGRDHSSHRLVGLGLSEKTTVWVLYGFAVFGGIVAFLMQRFPEQAVPIAGLYVLVLILTGVYLGYVKVETAEPNRLPPAWTPLVTELLYKRHAAEVLLDTVLIVICFYGAYLLRFEGSLSEETKDAIVISLPLVVASCLAMHFLAGIYRGQWRLISVSDLPCYAIGVFGGASFSLAAVTIVTRFGPGHSRSAFIIFGVLAFLAVSGSRLSLRLLDSVFHRNSSERNGEPRKPILIFGAGRTGKIIQEEITFSQSLKEYVVIGFLDDDPNLRQRTVNRVPVLGSSSDLSVILESRSVASVVIASDKIRDDRLQNVLSLCEERRIPVLHAHLKFEPMATNGNGGNGERT